MMPRAASLVVAAAVVVVAVRALPAADDTRYVQNPTTANQVLDNIIERALQIINSLGWADNKRGKNGDAELPMEVSRDVTERFSISDVMIRNLGSLTRSKTATFNADKTVLRGTVMVQDASIQAAYTASFPGVGAAPQQVLEGQVTETVKKLFADIEVNVDSSLTPQSIVSYTVRSGQDTVAASGIGKDNAMKPLHLAGFRKALRQILESTMATNVKVQLNKAIQQINGEAAA